ncbi:MAG: hypothetical protein E5V49_07880 [Mesorhizobium sp.]|nr:hypothetical protein EN848_11490 [bacterium M00.F.Ca.ET.205.01.1.1]TGU55436.1 hypothetical protein EN795_01535 [bacterium M00.F.Ca.ET.152.01.1.1]TGV40278.1 hypothetical protein EN829_002905 [Mesorhizobium sp. M00.F.Ca.ET.186.01.1.1]TGZ45269.1 hypothetical protein EN805_02885 [bacterium M00.F.Ca.ET.162.01.1.1]TJW33453.1 MAG: hypothetical protein E5V49_07880 [Mesorhizobium sp.]
MAISRDIHNVVIHGRSKERSDAAQTRGSMPGLRRVATVQNSVPLHSKAKVPAWIPGSPRRSFAPASPRNDEVTGLRLTLRSPSACPTPKSPAAPWPPAIPPSAGKAPDHG